MSGLVSRRQFVQATVVAGALVGCGMTLRLVPAAPGARVLCARELEIVAALATAMFPGAPFPLDGVQAGVPERVDAIVADMLEGGRAAAFRYTLRALEVGTHASRGLPFSQLGLTARQDVLAAWSDPDVLPRRLALDAIRTVMGMAYFEHPEIRAAIGWKRGCGGG